MRSLRTPAAMACAFLVAASAAAQEEAAIAAFLKAQDIAAKGRYADAVGAYRQVALKYPETTAGRHALRRAQPSAFLSSADILRSGPSANRVDVVVMGDGYTLVQQNAFDDVAKSVPKTFQQNLVLGEYLAYHNFIRANLVSKDDGVDGLGRTYDTALGGHITNNDEYQVGVDHGLVMQMLGELPEQDRLAVVFVRKGSLGTGGSGVATVGGRADDTVVHEWGHAFAGLADEYVRGRVHRGEVRSRINVSGTRDPKLVPWKHWLEARAPGIGVYEGAAGIQRGAWKPTTGGCIMDTGGLFCRVCAEALVLAIHEYVDPIDQCAPDVVRLITPSAAGATGSGPVDFAVTVMRPKSHALQVRWWVLPEASVPQGRAVPDRDPRTGRRGGRGPLPPIREEPARTSLNNARADHSFRLMASGLKPGRYRIVCRVRDTTRIGDDQWPLVLEDRNGLLESERGWWVEVRG